MVVGVVPTQSQAAKIKLSAKKVTIKLGSEATIYVLGYSKKVKWSSTNKKIATVRNGEIIAKSEGECTVKARCGKKTLSCKVVVTYPDKDKAHEIWEYAHELSECISKLYRYQEYAGDEYMLINDD